MNLAGDVPAEEDAEEEAEIDPSDEHYTYDLRGRDWKWTCKKGSEQSPIDIEAIKGYCDKSMQFDFNLAKDPIETEVVQERHRLTIDGEFSKLYATDVSGVLAGYNAYNMHFHSPSEHKIEGTTFDAELHIMHTMRNEFHKGQTRTKAVVAVLFTVNDNERPDEFVESLVLGKPGPVVIDMSLLRDSLPENIVYFSY